MKAYEMIFVLLTVTKCLPKKTSNEQWPGTGISICSCVYFYYSGWNKALFVSNQFYKLWLPCFHCVEFHSNKSCAPLDTVSLP